ncbi:MAG: transcriptional repressor [Dehalococcoidia bacterium]|nr:transcriptional repressor [Dehalococcoidia bacterium]
MTQYQIKRALRGSGRKATPQRLAIAAALEGMEAHFTPRMLHAKLRLKHPEIGLVTVYRTLNLLAEDGLICRMGRSGGACSYASCPPKHHHHIICVSCSKVVDFEACGLEEMERKLMCETGFIIADHSLEFTGLCRSCQIRGTE